MRPVIIFMSHGDMAKETLKSAEMIVGKTTEVFAVSMGESDGLQGVSNKLDKILYTFNKEQDIIIIADLKGGTPCNVAMLKMNEFTNLKVVSGLNLAMAIEGILSTISSSETLSVYLEGVGKLAVESIDPTRNFGSEDDDEFEE